MEEEVGGSGFLVGRQMVEEDRGRECCYEAARGRRRRGRDERGRDHDGGGNGGRRAADGERQTAGKRDYGGRGKTGFWERTAAVLYTC